MTGRKMRGEDDGGESNGRKTRGNVGGGQGGM